MEDTDLIIDTYTVEIKAIEMYESDSETLFWKFIVHYKVLEDDDDIDNVLKNIEIVSYRAYENMYDAIQDSYGVIELFGFQFSNKEPQEIEILRYNLVDNSYDSDYILYDGFDFYHPEKKQHK
jgi:hypothetical protein